MPGIPWVMTGDDLVRAHLLTRYRNSLKDSEVKEELLIEYNGNELQGI